MAETKHTPELCPDCGEPDNHLYPDNETGGRCRDCCPTCSAAAKEAAEDAEALMRRHERED